MKTPTSDEAVKRATGKDWAEWLKVLDKEGAKKMGHREIVEVVSRKYGVGPWWQQMVTVGYERARGLRDVHQTATGFVANASRTIAAPVEELSAAWSDGRRRAKWLGVKAEVRKTASKKSLRFDWPDGTQVMVTFDAKGDAKSVVTIEHSKLAGVKDVAARKAFWSETLAKLKEMLER
jgi:uncharacterized protein YndB with AHSA1/START domain